MTLAELRQSVITNTRRSDKAADITGYINLAIKEIVQIEPFKDLRSETDIPLASGGNQIALPSSTAQVVEVRLLPDADDLAAASVTTNPATLQPAMIGYVVYIMDQRTLQNRFPNLQLNTRGIPEYCFVTGSTITFVPPSNLDRTVRVLLDGYAPELVDDTDDNPLPSCDNAVIAWASARTFRSLQLWQDAAGWDAEYARAIRLARSEAHRRPGQIRQMRGAMGTRPRYVDPRINNYTRQSYGDILQ